MRPGGGGCCGRVLGKRWGKWDSANSLNGLGGAVLAGGDVVCGVASVMVRQYVVLLCFCERRWKCVGVQ